MTPDHIEVAAAVFGALTFIGGVVWGIYRGAKSITQDYVTKQVCLLMHERHGKDIAVMEAQITRIHARIDAAFDATNKLALKVINGNHGKRTGGDSGRDD